jgi:hypothetical protein
MSLEPNRNEIEIFVDALLRHRGEEGYLSLRAFNHDNKSVFPRMWTAGLNGNGNFQRIVDHAMDMARRAANYRKPAVFCPPLAVFNNANGWQAREEDLLKGLVLSVECDEHPEEARQTLQDILGEATAIVRSGGQWVNGDGEPEDKLHLHWRLRTPATGAKLAKLKEARGLATAIAGGDPSNIPAVHCLRWPGSWHRKKEPRLCELVSCNRDVEIDLDTALKALEAAAPPWQDKGSTDDPWTGDCKRVDLVKLFAGMKPGNIHTSQVSATAALLQRGMKIGDVVDTVLAVTRLAIGDAGRAWDWVREARDLRAMCETWEKKRKAEEKAKEKTTFDPWQRWIVPDFPLTVLPQGLQDYVSEQSTLIGCDQATMAMCALTAISGAIHHRFAIKMMRNGDWFEHPRLWTLLVGPASYRKTPPINAVTKPIEDIQAASQKKFTAAMEEYKGLSKNEKEKADEPKPPPRWLSTDATPEKMAELLARSAKGILYKRDEFSGFVGSLDKYGGKSGSNADRAFFLKAYDGGSYTRDRVGDRNPVNSEIFVENLSISMLGGIQPDKLAEMKGLTSDGLLQRFTPVMMRAPNLPQDVPSSAQEDFDELINKLVNLPPKTLSFSDEALAVVAALRARLHELGQASEGMAIGFPSFVGKLAGIAGRLAVILHVVKHVDAADIPDRIDVDVAKAVQTLVLDFILPHAIEFYQSAEGAGGERLRAIASFILTSGKDTVTARDLIRGVRALRGMSVRDIQDAVSPLVAGGWLEPVSNAPDNRAWNVTPTVAEQFKKQRQVEEDRKAAFAWLIRGRSE